MGSEEWGPWAVRICESEDRRAACMTKEVHPPDRTRGSKGAAQRPGGFLRTKE